ncbi:hypothetical protein MRX96_008601 [Rhipicephalus microplus]
MDDEIARRRRQDLLQEYAGVCNCISRRLQKFSVEETSHFEATLNSSVEVTEELLTHYVENTEPNQSLLQFLIAMQKESFDPATLPSTLQSVLLSRANFLEEDILSTALLEEDPLPRCH